MTQSNFRECARQIIAFGGVGVLATLTHLGVAEGLLHAGWQAYIASFIGFMLGFSVSYSGHFYVTFRGKTDHKNALWRFLMVAVSGFVMSAVSLSVIRGLWPGQDALTLAVSILLIPAYTFVMARFWAFRA